MVQSVREGSRQGRRLSNKPVIQVDCAFLVSRSTGAQLPVLAAIDTTTGMTLACAMQDKGANHYVVKELVRFVHETGRSGGVLQPGVLHGDQERAINALLRQGHRT